MLYGHANLLGSLLGNLTQEGRGLLNNTQWAVAQKQWALLQAAGWYGPHPISRDLCRCGAFPWVHRAKVSSKCDGTRRIKAVIDDLGGRDEDQA